jgi:predicted permease
VLTGLVFGSIPLYHLLRRDLNAIFRQTGRTGTTERRALWTRSALVVAQVALAFVLLIGAGLLTMSFGRLLSVNPGFRPDRVYTTTLQLPNTRYRDDNSIRGFMRQLMPGIRALPGVEEAGTTTILPFSGDGNANAMQIVGRTLAPGEPVPVPAWNNISPGYFAAMGIPLLNGRVFTDGDGADSQKVAIIDEFFAHKYWPKGDAVGARIYRGLPDIMKEQAYICTIVGVVGSVKMGDLAEQNPVGQLYFPTVQSPSRGLRLAVRTKSDSPQIMAAVRSVVLRADPEMPLFETRSMPERLSASMRERRAAMAICLGFAGLALALATIGIYGVLAYTVTQRTREFGIRMAIGAGLREVVSMVLGQGLRLAAIGLALGVTGALLLTHLMTTLLFHVKPQDPGVFAIVAAALMAVACCAALVPALRVARIRPANALRHE